MVITEYQNTILQHWVILFQYEPFLIHRLGIFHGFLKIVHSSDDHMLEVWLQKNICGKRWKLGKQEDLSLKTTIIEHIQGQNIYKVRKVDLEQYGRNLFSPWAIMLPKRIEFKVSVYAVIKKNAIFHYYFKVLLRWMDHHGNNLSENQWWNGEHVTMKTLSPRGSDLKIDLKIARRKNVQVIIIHQL